MDNLPSTVLSDDPISNSTHDGSFDKKTVKSEPKSWVSRIKNSKPKITKKKDLNEINIKTEITENPRLSTKCIPSYIQSKYRTQALNDEAAIMENKNKKFKRWKANKAAFSPDKISRTRREPGKDNDDSNSSPSNTSSSKYSLILTFMLLMTALVVYDSALISFDRIDLDGLQKDLNNKFHGQLPALDSVLTTMKAFYHNEAKPNVMNLIGPSGVGKTFMANLIKKHFHASTFELLAPFSNRDKHLTFLTNNVIPKFSRYNLILIDGLTVSDIKLVLTLIEKIPDDMPVLVICIFNIQETDNNLNHYINYSHIDVIKEEFSLIKFSSKNVLFREFGTDDVKDWLMKQLNERKVKSETALDLVNSIAKEHIVKYSGLKGLNAKLLKL